MARNALMESNDKTFSDDILRISHRGDMTTPVILVFWAEWARRCRCLDDWLDGVKTRFPDAPMITMNTDTNPVTADAYNVEEVPTIAIVTSDEVLWRCAGPLDIDDFAQAWRKTALKAS